jgi:RNA polymerase sigma factor (sigma-70 family)
MKTKKKKFTSDNGERDPRRLKFTRSGNTIVHSLKLHGVELYPLVKSIAHNRWKKNKKVDYEDIIGELLLNLAKVISRYNPKFKAKLSTYVYPRLYYSGIDHMKEESEYLRTTELHANIVVDEADPYSLEDVKNVKLFFDKVIKVVETRLSRRHSIALIRAHFEGATDDLIAIELNIPLDRVAPLIADAIKEVRRYFPPDVRL